jgi:hypothetical protein
MFRSPNRRRKDAEKVSPRWEVQITPSARLRASVVICVRPIARTASDGYQNGVEHTGEKQAQ